MKKVKLIGPGLKIQNKWHWVNEIMIITNEEYEQNKKYLELIEDVEEKTGTANETNNNSEQNNKNNEQDNKSDENETKSDENDAADDSINNVPPEETSDDEELELLRAKAKSLGINPGNAKKETLLKKIEEAEKNHD